MSHPFNETDSMADILLLNPQGEYDIKFPKEEECIYRYKYKSAG